MNPIPPATRTPVADLMDRAAAGGRLSPDEALALFACDDLLALGAAADRARWRLHPDPVVTYIVDRTLNYSNVCVTGCGFCAFFRPPGHPETFLLSRDAIRARVEALRAEGGAHLLLQGGHHPDLRLPWYEDLLRWLKAEFHLHLHALSPPEIVHLSRLEGIPVGDVIRRLRAAGLDSLPGGGAEILADRVRARLSPRKCTADAWIGVMREAHRQGLRTTATLMFGHVETSADRVEHLRRVRDLQDETGGFTAFIPWTFQSPRTPMLDGHPMAGGADYLKTLAVSRLFLDNVPHLQASWLTQGPKIAQLALRFGADDVGGTILEERVVSAAGCGAILPRAEIERIITGLGLTPRRRNFFYDFVVEGV
jgi:cyclic dehypoxanthinyl futalosine synthase